MYSMFNHELRWEKDAAILSRSILGLSEKNSLSREISLLISKYSRDKNKQSWQALARQLWAEHSSKIRL